MLVGSVWRWPNSSAKINKETEDNLIHNSNKRVRRKGVLLPFNPRSGVFECFIIFKLILLTSTATTLLEQDLFYRLVQLYPWVLRRQATQSGGWHVASCPERDWRYRSKSLIKYCRGSFLVGLCCLLRWARGCLTDHTPSLFPPFLFGNFNFNFHFTIFILVSNIPVSLPLFIVSRGRSLILS